MSIFWTEKVWKFSAQTGSALLVMLAIADYCDAAGFCFPSIPVLAQKARLGTRQVQRILPILENDGELQVIRAAGRSKTPVFQILIKGDISDVKGDISGGKVHEESLKGDNSDTFSGSQKGDICEIKGDISDVKGDISGTPPTPPNKDNRINHEEPLKPEERAKPSLSEKQNSSPPDSIVQPAKRSATRLPADFGLTEEMRKWAKEKTPGVDLEFSTDEFKDFWHGASRNAEKLDWNLTWKTRMRELQRRFDEKSRQIASWQASREKQNGNNYHRHAGSPGKQIINDADAEAGVYDHLKPAVSVSEWYDAREGAGKK